MMMMMMMMRVGWEEECGGGYSLSNLQSLSEPI